MLSSQEESVTIPLSRAVQAQKRQKGYVLKFSVSFATRPSANLYKDPYVLQVRALGDIIVLL